MLEAIEQSGKQPIAKCVAYYAAGHNMARNEAQRPARGAGAGQMGNMSV